MEYKFYKKIESSRAVIRVYAPVLTEEEQARRLEAVKKAAIALLKG